MKVLFAGAGAIGSHYGSRLQQAGNHITYFTRGAHLHALQQHGLLHESEGKTCCIDVNSTDNLDGFDNVDVVVFSCKMTGLRALIDRVCKAVKPGMLLVTLQNGVEAPEWVAELFPNNAIAAGTAFIGARLEKPGHVIHSAAGGVRAGLWQADAGERWLPELIEQLKVGGVAARIDSDPTAMLWRKLLWNTGFNAMTAITRRYAKQMCESDETLEMVHQAMAETVAVAQAEGVAIGEADIRSHIDVTLAMGPVKTSMWQDIEAGHQTEVDYLNGVVVRKGEACGVATPVNRMLVALIHAIESRTKEL